MSPRYVAHRGGAALWPENSLLAFRNAIALGARVLELDVHPTADGGVAVIHDPTLDRTTDATGRVADRTVAELRAVRLRGRDGAVMGEHVPTLDEVLALAAPAGVALLVEVKTPGPAVLYERRGDAVTAVPGPCYDGFESRVLEAVRRSGMADRVFVMAFNPAVLAEVHRLAPGQPTALLVDGHHIAAAGVPATEAVAWAAAAGASYLGLSWRVCDAAVVAAAQRAGIAVAVFTVNDETEIRRLAALGVDVIITDRADLATRLGAEAS